MGFIGLLFNVAVECFDVLAWPLFALGYPLCASIQAIETNSNLDSRKVNTYWVCLSLILMFEHAFGKLLEWLPYWPSTKLIIVGCLVIPHFDGSFYIYRHIVRPCLSVNPQNVLNWFIKLKEFLNQNNILVEVKTEAKETRPDAADNLIPFGSLPAFKMKEFSNQDYDLLVKENKEIKETEPDAMENLISFGSFSALKPKLEDSEVEQKEINAVEIMEKEEIRQIKPDLALPGNSTYASAVIKDLTPETVDVTQENKEMGATTFAGKQHVNACGNPTGKELMSNAPPEFGCNLPDEPHSKSTQRKWSCVVCKVTAKGKKDLVSHFQGKRHEDALEKLKVKIETARSKILAAVMETRAAPENKEMAAKAGCNLPDEPHSKNVEMPWTCSICRVTITAETSLVSHLQGRRHKDTCEKLKVLMQTPKMDNA